MPKSSAPIQPPIPDINHNGLLDGQDILAQLELENKTHTSTRPAHDIFYALNIRNFRQRIEQSPYAPLGTLLTNTIKNKIPHVGAENSVEQKIAELKVPENLTDFVSSFKKTFPKDIKIEDKDAAKILEHFGLGHLTAPRIRSIPDNGEVNYKKASLIK